VTLEEIVYEEKQQWNEMKNEGKKDVDEEVEMYTTCLKI
jgi:hypothetical protein